MTRVVVMKNNNTYLVEDENFPFMHQNRLSYHFVILSEETDENGNPKKSFLSVAAEDISEIISPFSEEEYNKLVESKNMAISFLQEQYKEQEQEGNINNHNNRDYV